MKSRPIPEDAPRAAALTLAALLATALATGFATGGFFAVPDSQHYLAMADGRPAMLPFAGRVLGPLLARGLGRLLHVPVETGFLVEGVAALAIFAGAVVLLLVRSGAPRWMLPAIAGLFFWSLQFGGLVLPDLPHAALLSLLLVLLDRGRTLAAVLLLAPLAVTRESTVLVLLCLLAAGWRQMRRLEIGTAIAATLAGLAIAPRLSLHALPNREHIPSALYLAAKLPWNLLKNFFGIDPWANVYRACPAPLWSVAVHLGPLRAVGVCGFDTTLPLHLAVWGLGLFGLLPLLMLKLRGSALALAHGDDLPLRFGLLYGGVSYVLAGTLGFSVWRLFGYSWPLFLVALPRVLGADGADFRSARAAAVFVMLHLGLSWLVRDVQDIRALLAAVLAWAAGAWLLRRSWTAGQVSPAPGMAPGSAAVL